MNDQLDLPKLQTLTPAEIEWVLETHSPSRSAAMLGWSMICALNGLIWFGLGAFLF